MKIKKSISDFFIHYNNNKIMLISKFMYSFLFNNHSVSIIFYQTHLLTARSKINTVSLRENERLFCTLLVLCLTTNYFKIFKNDSKNFICITYINFKSFKVIIKFFLNIIKLLQLDLCKNIIIYNNRYTSN